MEQWAVRPQMCDLDVDLRLAEQLGRVVVSAERLCHGRAYGRQRGLAPGALNRHRSVGAALQRPAKPGEYVGVHTEQRTDPPAHLSQALGSDGVVPEQHRVEEVGRNQVVRFAAQRFGQNGQ
jgi:hypothetical protein